MGTVLILICLVGVGVWAAGEIPDAHTPYQRARLQGILVVAAALVMVVAMMGL
jgi:hypothetical protein